MKYAISMIVLTCIGTANAQDLMTRIAGLEANNAVILQRMASVESKIDALGAKIDRLTPGAPPAAPEQIVTTFYGADVCSVGASSCGSAGASSSCGSASSGRRRLFGRLRSGGCGN